MSLTAENESSLDKASLHLSTQRQTKLFIPETRAGSNRQNASVLCTAISK